MRYQYSILFLLQKINQLVSGKMCSVKGSYNLNYPAMCSDGKDIQIREEYLAPKTAEELALLKGINYHELAHVLLSPRKRPFNHSVYNMMEDGRIETQMVQKFPSLLDYYTISTNHLLIKKYEEVLKSGTKPSRNASISAFLLLWGRMYLGKKIRDHVYKALPFPDDQKKELAALFGSYLALTSDQIEVEGASIVEKVATMVGDQHQMENPCESVGGVMRLRKADREELAKAVAKALEEEEDGAEEMSQDSNPATGVTDEVPEQVAAGQSVGGGTEGEENEEEEGKEEASGSTEGTGTGSGSSLGGEDEAKKDKPEEEEDLTSLLEKVEVVLEHSEASVERQCRQEINEAMAESKEGHLQVGNRDMKMSRPTEDMIAVSDRLVRVFEDLNHQQKRGYVPGQKTGTLNLRSLMQSGQTGNMSVFKKFQNDFRRTASQVAFCLDISGSMEGRRLLLASRALWIMQRAFRKMSVPISGWTFDDEQYQVVFPNTIVKDDEYPVYSSHGNGTAPFTALKSAIEFLAPARERAILIVITDGAWGHRGEHKLISSFAGLSVQIGIGTLNKHGFTHELEVNSVESLLDRLCHMMVRLQREMVLR